MIEMCNSSLLQVIENVVYIIEQKNILYIVWDC